MRLQFDIEKDQEFFSSLPAEVLIALSKMKEFIIIKVSHLSDDIEKEETMNPTAIGIIHILDLKTGFVPIGYSQSLSRSIINSFTKHDIESMYSQCDLTYWGKLN